MVTALLGKRLALDAADAAAAALAHGFVVPGGAPRADRRRSRWPRGSSCAGPAG